MTQINEENNSAVVPSDTSVEDKAIVQNSAKAPEKLPSKDSEINESIRQYQLSIDDWEKHSFIEDLHKWKEIFIFEFKLKIQESPVIKIDFISRKRYGHFMPGRNGFGLRNEIAINQTYNQCREYWQVLGTLLHELLHAEQEQIGKSGKHNYHNKAFRSRAELLGLIIDEWGHTKYLPAPSSFFDVLKKHNVPIPNLSKLVIDKVTSGNSKLKLWVCKCRPRPIHVRVAIEDFQATCKKCGADFEKQELRVTETQVEMQITNASEQAQKTN